MVTADVRSENGPADVRSKGGTADVRSKGGTADVRSENGPADVRSETSRAQVRDGHAAHAKGEADTAREVLSARLNRGGYGEDVGCRE